jgi:hypothetical protein
VATVVFVTEVEDEDDSEEVVAERDSILSGWDSRETRRLLSIMSLRTQNRLNRKSYRKPRSWMAEKGNTEHSTRYTNILV